MRLNVRHSQHSDAAGNLVHGSNIHEQEVKLNHAPRLFQKFKQWVHSQLLDGQITQQIMAKHTKAVLPQLESKTADRDCFLHPQDICNINLKLAQFTWKLHDNEAQFARLFHQQHSEFAFINQEERHSQPQQKCPRSVQYEMFLSTEEIMLMLLATGQGRDSFAQQVRDAVDIIDAFYMQYAQHAEYVSYFQKQWGQKTDEWVRGFQGVPHAQQDTTGACEDYHSAIKGNKLANTSRLQGRRVNWLLYLLWTEVDIRIRYKQAYKTAGFETNRKAEGVSTDAMVAAQAIPNSFVELICSSGTVALHGQTCAQGDQPQPRLHRSFQLLAHELAQSCKAWTSCTATLPPSHRSSLIPWQSLKMYMR
ncbi:TPA: hypothetical protein ACH3X2_012744 [Trebouxia sp. C0005]